MSHYAAASLPQQLDAFVWFDESSAVTPLAPQHAKAGAPDTYAFGSSLHRRHQSIRSTWDGPDPSQAPAIQVAVLRTQGCKISVCRSTAESAWTGSYVILPLGVLHHAFRVLNRMPLTT
jgi:hypothetical protein